MLDGGWSDEDPRGASVGGRDGVAVDGPRLGRDFKRRVPVRLRARLYPIPRVFSRNIKYERAVKSTRGPLVATRIAVPVPPHVTGQQRLSA